MYGLEARIRRYSMYEIGIAAKQDKVCRFCGIWVGWLRSTFLYEIQVSTHLFIVNIQYNIDFNALSAT